MARKSKVAVEVVAPVELVEEVVQEVVELEAPSELINTNEDFRGEEVDELVEVVAEPAPSELLALLMTPVAGEVVEKLAVVKNQGVGKMIRELITDGLSNTDVLKKVHDEYGNKNTTYACVAWYRNKAKKTAQVVSTAKAVEVVEKFLEEEVLTDVLDDESELETADELRQMVGL